MSYTVLEQYSRDIDYYIYNVTLGLLHFASAGGRLPRVIEANDIANEQLHENISQLPSDFKYITNPNLSEILGLNQLQLESYLTDFVEIAKKGICSFDKTNINNPEDQTYHLVAWPENESDKFWWPFDLPFQTNINNIILNRSKIPFSENPKENWTFTLKLD
ncbi:hypothetical protein [Flavobacterium ustbae]|uniref:hypothetical protein n=1 Tax=Flavobacterium ustbae TaxID=2488790 RepID=UPI000F78A0EA|nr:hypothetical protein [Flavobacterium ustbae]